MPAPLKIPARAMSSGAVAFEPAPWVRTRPSPPGVSGRWRNPRTLGSTALSTNSRMVDAGKNSF